MAENKKNEEISVTITPEGRVVSNLGKMDALAMAASMGAVAADLVDYEDLAEGERRLVRAYQKKRAERVVKEEKEKRDV